MGTDDTTPDPDVPELVDLSPATTAVVAGKVAMADIAGFYDRAFPAVAEALGRQGATPTGAAFGRYHGPPGEVADLEVGFPTDREVEADGEVRAGTLPGGRVAWLVHRGGYDGLGASWERLRVWITEQGLTPGDDLWEVYVTEPTPDLDPVDLRTELHWSVT